MTKHIKKFYKTTLKVDVLSENPFAADTLEDVHYAITEGDCSGSWHIEQVQDMTASEMAVALLD